MTTANKITIVRIMLIPVFVMMAIYYGKSVREGEPQEWQRFTAIIVFLLAAASDGLDGWVARRFNQRSRLGTILDPIADKGLLLAGIITLSLTDWGYRFPIWFPVLVIARDLVIITGTAVLHFLNGHVEVKPSWTGKTATVFQMAALACVMLQWNPFTIPITGTTSTLDFIEIPIFLAGAFTFISGFGYVLAGIHQLHETNHGQPE